MAREVIETPTQCCPGNDNGEHESTYNTLPGWDHPGPQQGMYVYYGICTHCGAVFVTKLERDVPE
jgi:hypothetical protein